MRRMTLLNGFALLSASFVGLAAACDSGTADTPPAVTPADAGGDGPADAGPHGRTLTISLDPTLDMDSDDVKATALTSADLLDTAGRAAATATIADGNAVFGLAGIAAGDYFVRVNGDSDDLVPTRLGDSSDDVIQRIGQKLRVSYVGPTSRPTYRINTWSSGQKSPPW